MFQFLLLFWPLQLTVSQVVFHEDFEAYNTGTTKVVYLAFNGTWYRSDVDKLTGLFKIKGPNTLIASKYLGVFAESASSMTCVDVTLTMGSVYQLSFDHAWEAYNTSTLYVGWNNARIFTFPSSGTEGSFISQTQQLPPVTIPVNQLCFYGYDPLSGIRIGLVIDNVEIVLVRAASTNTTNSSSSINGSSTNITNNSFCSNSSQINSSSNSSRNQTSNSTEVTPVGPDLYQEDPESSFINIHWVQGFVQKFNYILKYTSFVGFPYLISNLLNFWNVIVLYYFLPIKSYSEVYKTQLQQLCKISLQEGSLLSLLEKSFNRQLNLPNIKCQKIPPSTTKWPSFSQLGFTSQILINNVQFYFSIINCVVKLILLMFIRKVVRKIQCLSSFMFRSKIKCQQIFFYQIVSASPGLFIPLAIMVSFNSSTAFGKFSEKINNACQFLVIPLVAISICIPFLMKKNLTVTKPQRRVVKSTLMVESHHESEPSVKPGTMRKMTEKAINEIQYSRSVFEYRKNVRNQKYIHEMYIADTYNHILFFTVPFLIGFQCLWLFFLTNWLFLLFVSYNLYKKGPLIRQFNNKQFWFRVSINVVCLSIHILFALLYVVESNIISLDDNSVALISFLTIIMIIVGAIVETIHTLTSLLSVVFEVWKKLKPASNKIDAIRQTSEDQVQKKKTIDLQFHLRKISTFKLNQPDSVVESEGEHSKKTIEEQLKKKTKLTGVKTERISKIALEITDEIDSK